MSKILGFVICICISFSAIAQPGSKWQPFLQKAKSDSAKSLWSESVLNYKQALAILPPVKSNYNTIAATQLSLANIYSLQIKEPDSAINYYYASLASFDSAKNKNGFLLALNSLKNNLYDNDYYKTQHFNYPWLTKKEETIFVPMQNVRMSSEAIADYNIGIGQDLGLVEKKQGYVRKSSNIYNEFLDENNFAYYIFDSVFARKTLGRISPAAEQNLDSLILNQLYLLVDIEVPKHNYKTVFYNNFLNGAYLVNNISADIIPAQIALHYSSPFLEEVMADSLTKEFKILSAAMEDSPNNNVPYIFSDGKFKGKNVLEALNKIKPLEILDFFDYLNGNPQKYAGYIGYMAEPLVAWMEKTANGPIRLLDSMLILSNKKEELKSFQKRNQYLFTTAYFDVIRKEAITQSNKNNQARALAVSDALISLSEAGTDIYKIGDSYFVRGYILADENTKLSNEWYLKAKSKFKSISDTASVILTNQNLMVNSVSLKDYEEADKYLDENIEITKKQWEIYKNEYAASAFAKAHYLKGKNWSYKNNLDLEISEYRKALEISKTELDSIKYLAILESKFSTTNNYKEEVKTGSILLAKYLKNGEAYLAAGIMDNLGFAFSRLEQKEIALENYHSAYEIYLSQEDYPKAAFSQSAMAQVFWQRYEKDSAIYYHQRAIELLKKANDSAKVAYSYTKLGSLYKESGQILKSNEAFLTAENIYIKLPVSDEYGNLLRDKADNYYSVQQYQQSLDYYKRALDVYTKFDLKSNAESAKLSIADIYASLGKLENSSKILEEVLLANKSNINNINSYVYYYFIKGKIEGLKNNQEGILEQYVKGLQTAKELKDTANFGVFYNQIGRYYVDNDEVDSAFNYLHAARKAYEQNNNTSGLYGVYYNLGNYYIDIPEIDSAKIYTNKALELAKNLQDLNAQANAQMSLAYLDIILGNFDEALNRQKGLLNIYLNDNESFGISNSYINMGNILNRQTQFNEAIIYYNKADSIFKKLNFTQARSTPLNNAGTIYYAQGNIKKAQEQFTEALKIVEKGTNPDMFRTLLINLGEIFIDLKEFTKAENYLDSALKLSLKARDKRGVFLSEWLLGRSQLRQNNFAKSLPYLKSALRKCEMVEDKFFTSAIENELGENFFKLNQMDSAMAHWKNGVKYSQLIRSETYLWAHYSGLAKVYLQENNNEMARIYLDSAIKVVEGIKLRVSGGDEARKIFSSGESVIELYQKMVVVLKALGKNDEALLYLEKANVENINTRLTNENHNTKEDAEAEAKKRLLLSIEKQKLTELSKPAEKQSTESIARLEKMQTIAEKDYLNFVNELAKKYPNRTDLQQINAREFKKERAFIPESVALLSYLITPNELSIFVVTKDSLLIKDIPVNKQLLEDKIKEYYAALSRNAGTLTRGNVKIGKKENANVNIDSLSAFLYQLLVEPAISGLTKQNKIAIIPSGFLSFVPFQALGKPVNNQMQYFGNEKEIFYVNRITNVTNGRGESFNNLKIIAVGNADNSLPFAEAEVKAIMLQNPTSISFIKEAATKKNVLNQEGDYNILHLATHGILNYNSVDSSYLLLAKDPSSNDDGKLHINDINTINNLDRFKLVTLSACETAVVKDLVDGWPISTAAAFLEAGVGTVVASLWQVDDKATGLLMEEFYKNLQTMSKVESLQKAQQYIQKMPNYSNPYYWAAFQVVGLWK